MDNPGSERFRAHVNQGSMPLPARLAAGLFLQECSRESPLPHIITLLC